MIDMLAVEHEHQCNDRFSKNAYQPHDQWEDQSLLFGAVSHHSKQRPSIVAR